MIALGLLLLAAAVIVALVGVFANLGSGHALNSDFNLFGYHVHGSTGQLLLIGIIVGAVGMLGLNMLLAGIGRGFTRRVSNRRELKQTRRQADSLYEERQTLAQQLEQERVARARTEAGQAADRERVGNAGAVSYSAVPGSAGPAAASSAPPYPATAQPVPVGPGQVGPGQSGFAQPASTLPGPAQPTTQSGLAQPGSAPADSPGVFRRFMKR